MSGFQDEDEKQTSDPRAAWRARATSLAVDNRSCPICLTTPRQLCKIPICTTSSKHKKITTVRVGTAGFFFFSYCYSHKAVLNIQLRRLGEDPLREVVFRSVRFFNTNRAAPSSQADQTLRRLAEAQPSFISTLVTGIRRVPQYSLYLYIIN